MARYRAQPGAHTQLDASSRAPSAASERSLELAATPPPTIRSVTSYAGRLHGLAVSTSATALEGRRHVGGVDGSPAACAPHHGPPRLQAREREVKRAIVILARGKLMPGIAVAGASSIGGPRETACRVPGPPCRTPRRPRRRWWRRVELPPGHVRASSSEEWPPTRAGPPPAPAGPCSSWSTAMCAARWLTPYSGLPARTHTPWRAARRAERPASPAPVTATASIPPGGRGGRDRAVEGRDQPPGAPGGHLGTTPPNRACSSTLEATQSASIRDRDQPMLSHRRSLDAKHQRRGHQRAPSA